MEWEWRIKYKLLQKHNDFNPIIKSGLHNKIRVYFRDIFWSLEYTKDEEFTYN